MPRPVGTETLVVRQRGTTVGPEQGRPAVAVSWCRWEESGDDSPAEGRGWLERDTESSGYVVGVDQHFVGSHGGNASRIGPAVRWKPRASGAAAFTTSASIAALDSRMLRRLVMEVSASQLLGTRR